ncbi:MAG TPA: HXXEE domain-containing protein [Pyrinomonadaceae bacterium]|nr:HXXEE domain-containing protein [Pyrinomonadaceae bacterium]
MTVPTLPGKEYKFWPWLFPITYAIHIAEELYGGEGYSAYLERLRGIHITHGKFMLAHGIGLVLMVFGILLARRLNFPNLFNVVLGTTVLVNSFTHTIQTLYHGEYVPGLVTGLLIWLPLGVATLVWFKKSLSSVRYLLSMVLGVGINVVVELLILKS